jgi:hypothetical protein
MENNNKSIFINRTQKSLDENTFVKITLSKYVGINDSLNNVYIKKVIIKNKENLNFIYRHKTKDITKNYPIEEALLIINNLLDNDFKSATLFTINNDFLYEKRKANKSILKELQPSIKELPLLDHNRQKNRKVKDIEHKQYLQLLSLTDKNGHILAKSQDKFKQINHYIEILSPLFKNLNSTKKIKITDMGSGKGYLTFAVYDYLVNSLKLDVAMDGVECRKELVNLCNNISQSSGFCGLKFIENNIKDYITDNLDVLIALHACDTATDDAIYKGINSGASLIVVAPCCHHQIRNEIEKAKKVNIMSPIIKHGIFLEREAEIITDGLRSLIMEYFGYRTKVVEFISDAHTHKNVMIIGEYATTSKIEKVEILDKIKDIKDTFGIKYHYLEKEMGLF